MNRIEFSDQVEGRYDRHQLIAWWDQSVVSRAHLLVAGAGALGNEVLKLLALIGVGHIRVVDFDTISRSNLSRMVLFREGEIGRPKVEVVVERLHEINSDVEVQGIQGDLRFDIGLGDYRAANIVIGCLDSVNARWALNRKCLQAGVNWIDGGISDHHGLVAHYSPSGGACYECNFTPATLERFNRRYSCPFGLTSDEVEAKVPTTAITTSVIAGIQVQQALLWLHGVENDRLQPGERLLVYLKPFRMMKDRLPQNSDCLAHNSLPIEIPILNGSNELTVKEVIASARLVYPEILALSLSYDLVTDFDCPACGFSEEINRPKEKVFHQESHCPKCGQFRQPIMLSAITQDQKESALSLKEIGIPPREILAFNTSGESVFLQITE